MLCFALDGVVCDGTVSLSPSQHSRPRALALRHLVPPPHRRPPTHLILTQPHHDITITVAPPWLRQLYLEYTNSTDADDPVDATSCNDRVYTSSDTIFNRSQPCYFIDPNNKHDFHTALALSVFFGPLGLDRFYLG